MPSDLKSHEREEREVERLINKDRAPSRSKAPKGAPKHDNRRRRIKEKDEDLDSVDKDLSLNYKYAASEPDEPDDTDLEGLIGSIRKQISKSDEKFVKLFDNLRYGKGFSSLPYDAKLEKLEHIKRVIEHASKKKYDFFLFSQQVSKAYGQAGVYGRSGVVISVRNFFRDLDFPHKFVEGLIRVIVDSNADSEKIDTYIEEQVEALVESGIEIDVPPPEEIPYEKFDEHFFEILNVAPPISEDDISELVNQMVGSDHDDMYKIVHRDYPKFSKSDEFNHFLQDIEHEDTDNKKDLVDSLIYWMNKFVNWGGVDKLASQTSYHTRNGEMVKTATYHGVISQGHPSGPTNRPWSLKDRRYHTPDDYKGIVKAAKTLMKEDWFSSYDSVDSDSKFRAALDISISTYSDSQFQGTIDAPTYDMLLASLMGQNPKDLFTETLITSNRSASMNHNFVRIANQIMSKNPSLSFKLIGQAVRGTVASGLEIGHIKEALEDVSKAKDGESLAEALKDLAKLTKTAGRVASEMVDLEAIEDMTDEQVKELLESSKEKAKELSKQIDEFQKSSEKDFTAVSDSDVEELINGIMGLIGEAGVESGKVKSASVRVEMRTLVAAAQTSPEARRILYPFIVASKKKAEKAEKMKKDDKKPGKKDDKKDEKSGKKDEKKDEKSNKKFEEMKAKKTKRASIDHDW